VSKREVSQAVDWYTRERMREWLAQHPDENDVTFGEKLGVSKVTVGDVVRRGKNVGAKLALGLSKLLGVPHAEFEAQAEAAYRKRPGETRIEPEERYPNRAAVLGPVEGELDPKAARAVRSLELHSPSDPPRLWWMRRIVMEADRVQFEREHPEAVEAKRQADAKEVDRVSGEIQGKMAKAREEIARRKKGDG
jgi:plasmid maintenance system antidote protein VapI